MLVWEIKNICVMDCMKDDGIESSFWLLAFSC